MELTRTYRLPCEGCTRTVFELRVVDGAKLCGICVEKSARIDRLLAGVSRNDPVACDGCGNPVDFDAKIAVITRECGGVVLCKLCNPAAIEGRASS